MANADKRDILAALESIRQDKKSGPATPATSETAESMRKQNKPVVITASVTKPSIDANTSMVSAPKGTSNTSGNATINPNYQNMAGSVSAPAKGTQPDHAVTTVDRKTGRAK